LVSANRFVGQRSFASPMNCVDTFVFLATLSDKRCQHLRPVKTTPTI
jgi:hypothetical protein